MNTYVCLHVFGTIIQDLKDKIYFEPKKLSIIGQTLNRNENNDFEEILQWTLDIIRRVNLIIIVNIHFQLYHI